ncbi:serine/threonine-protein kinase [Geothrix fermentans]|uniref:serine/threonine-protein kinase n=1 Tax=Geothrix fermentans TaxID=44676 RepID=UPI000407EA86|nr:serine/threonine-protein kinase [Geothrix fermentans]
MRARAGWLLPAAIALLAQEQPTFYAAWQDGLDAEHAGRWQEAAAAYRRALVLRPAPSARIFTYGNNLLQDYYPHTRLARCLMELGDLDGAEAALAEAQGEPEGPRNALVARIHALRPARPAPADAARTVAAPTPGPASDPVSPPAVPAPSPLVPSPPVPEEPVALPASRTEPGQPAAAQPRPSEIPSEPTPRTAPPVEPPGPPPLPRWIPWAVGLGLAAAGLSAWVRWRRRRALFGRSHGFSSRPPAGPLEPPHEVGPYRVGPLLGRGGFSSTYLAWHVETGRDVALKLPHPHRLDDLEFRRRFRQEAQIGARLEHPNLVRILDPGPAEGAPYLAMEYLPGRTLDQRLKEEGALPVEEARTIALQVAQAMAYAHGLGVVHRDLKPGNIVLTPFGARVMDLGIARVMDAATVTTTYAFLGTPLYAAPEAQLKTHVGPAADRYSLGVILFHMLAGVPPFQGETPFEILDRHRASPPPDLRALRPEVPAALARLVARLMDKEPDQRPEDGEVVNLLMGSAALSDPPEAGPPR